jgi:two-component system, NtrC family, nitrogen regulation sensor histidine kinase NtrY
MISKNLYLNLSIRVLLLVILSVLAGYLIANGKSLRFSLICFMAIAILTANLISFLNVTNKKIRYFFDSVRNDDSNLYFPVGEKNKTVREIYRNMNRVNEQIQKLKIENRNQEQYFRTLIEHLAIGIITFNNKGFILHSNASARKLMETDVLTHIRQLERIDKKLYQTVNSIKPSERKLVPMKTERGEIQLSLKAVSLRTNNDEFVILSVQDIKNELDEKEVESWMKLIRILMHEIMNSITPITSLSESLSHVYSKEGQPVLPDQITAKTIATTLQGLNVIKDQGKGLMSFVESYRKLTRIPVPDKKLFKVADLFNRLKILYASEGESSITELSFFIEDPDLEIFADQNLISQVLINLVKNALEAIENIPEGKIMISAGISSDLRPEICVSDNGPGIPAENLDEIFVPFFTTRQNGSGIGLSLSRQIMRVHGGNLRVFSVPRKETKFCLTF